MPNWSEGNLKVRGKYEDVVKFFVENIEVVGFMGNSIENGLTIDDYEDSVELSLKSTGYIKGTRRNFTESDYINIHKRKDGTSCVCAEIKGAWAIESEPYVNFSKQYDLDIKIESFERGMEFSQFILIQNGELIKDECKKYEDYTWDCVMPNLGG